MDLARIWGPSPRRPSAPLGRSLLQTKPRPTAVPPPPWAEALQWNTSWSRPAGAPQPWLLASRNLPPGNSEQHSQAGGGRGIASACPRGGPQRSPLRAGGDARRRGACRAERGASSCCDARRQRFRFVETSWVQTKGKQENTHCDVGALKRPMMGEPMALPESYPTIARNTSREVAPGDPGEEKLSKSCSGVDLRRNVGHFWAIADMFSTMWSDFGKNKRSRPKLVLFWQKFAKHCPNHSMLVNCWPVLAKIRQMLPRIGQFESKMPNLGQTSPRGWAHFAQIGETMAKPAVAEIASNLGTQSNLRAVIARRNFA